MSSVEKILCNPGSSCIYVNHRFFYAIGNTPSVDLTEGCELPEEPKFLLLGCGDIRNILRTVQDVSDIKPIPKSLTFHLNDIDDVLLARNAVLIQVVNTIDPNKRDDVEFLWNVWYNLELPPGHLQRLRSIMSDILENPLGCLTFESECSVAVKKVIKYWLKVNMDIREAKSLRENFMRQKIAADNKNSVESTTFMTVVNNLIECSKYLVDAYDVLDPSKSRRILDDLTTYFQTGSTHIISANSGTNPTFFCPHVNGWRVHPSLLPYSGFEENLFDDRLSLRENCIQQLQLQVKNWKVYRQTKGIIRVSLWYEEALTLCNSTMPAEMKFHFINTSNLCDHINVLNVLLAASRRLERSGVLSLQPMNWSTGGYGSVEMYLKAQTGIPISFYPTFLGLHLAEDFELGTNKRPKPHLSSAVNELYLRWVAADPCQPGISIADSPEIVGVLESVAEQCFSMLLDSPNADPLNTPLTLVFLMHQLAKNIQGGVKPLLEVVERCLPTEMTVMGERFCPLEQEWNVLKSYHFRNQLDKDLTDDLAVCSIAMAIKNPIQKPAGCGLPVKAVVTKHPAYFLPFDFVRRNTTWIGLTTLHYDYRAEVLKYVMPRSTLETLLNENSNANMQLLRDNVVSNVFGPLHTAQLRFAEVAYVPKEYGVFQKCRDSDDMTYKKDEVELVMNETAEEYQITLKSKSTGTVIRMVEVRVPTMQTKTATVTCKLSNGDNERNVTMNIRFSCCIEQSLPIRCTRKDSVTISKSKDQIQGPVLLFPRKRIISTYPCYTGSRYTYDKMLGGMFLSDGDLKVKLDRTTDGNALFQVKETIALLLQNAINPPAEKPLVRAYRLLRNDRPGRKMFGYFPEDIFIGVRGLYNIQGLPTLDIVWLDFKVYRTLVPYKQGIDSEEAVKFLEENAGMNKDACHLMTITVEEANLLKKLLSVNSLSTVQEIDESPRWRFYSFLQPVYSITAELDVIETVTRPERIQNMARLMQTVSDPSSPENIQNQPPRCHHCKLSILDMKKCSRCKAVYYCTKSCQRIDWKAGHSKVCQDTQTVKDKSVFPKNDPEEDLNKCTFCGTIKSGMKKCSKCKAVAYCSKACQMQDWKAAHHSICHKSPNSNN